MATVPQKDRSSNPAPRAYHSTLYDEHGFLTRDDVGRYLFTSSTTYAEIVLEPDMLNWIVVNGEIGLCEAQALADRRHGGAVGVCLSRLQEVA
jgi:hypothetical protein